MKKVHKAVIPVAGMGTRFLPATKAVPKEMLPIVDKPALQYIIEECVESGIDEILFITSPYKKCIEDHFDQSFELEHRLAEKGKTAILEGIQNISKMCKYYFIRQGEPLGSGHAVNLARSFIGDEPFAVLYGDDLMMYDDKPVLRQLIDLYEEKDCNVIGVQEVAPELVSRYGIMKFDELGRIVGLSEKPEVGKAPSNFAGLGRYIVKPEIFEELDKVPKGSNGEYPFTTAMLTLMEKQDFYPCKYKGTYYDIGNKFGYLKANIDFGLKNKEVSKDLDNYLRNELFK